mmetsp:Transcript_124078/g.264554  ORF Transcript_124078/g.264554 Transcript_124078/m.264554 type:complete len:238 (-) Transcript_124078:183-896(-)
MPHVQCSTAIDLLLLSEHNEQEHLLAADGADRCIELLAEVEILGAGTDAHEQDGPCGGIRGTSPDQAVKPLATPEEGVLGLRGRDVVVRECVVGAAKGGEAMIADDLYIIVVAEVCEMVAEEVDHTLNARYKPIKGHRELEDVDLIHALLDRTSATQAAHAETESQVLLLGWAGLSPRQAPRGEAIVKLQTIGCELQLFAVGQVDGCGSALFALLHAPHSDSLTDVTRNTDDEALGT